MLKVKLSNNYNMIKNSNLESKSTGFFTVFDYVNLLTNRVFREYKGIDRMFEPHY